jgi:hypothetical protein
LEHLGSLFSLFLLTLLPYGLKLLPLFFLLLALNLTSLAFFLCFLLCNRFLFFSFNLFRSSFFGSCQLFLLFSVTLEQLWVIEARLRSISELLLPGLLQILHHLFLLFFEALIANLH